MSLQDDLHMEYRISHQCLKDHDFYEGVRAGSGDILSTDFIIIYIIIRDCTRVGAFPRAFCVPNSVALASLTLQVVDWAIH